MVENFLIVGLGNPGKEYELTRHNLGFLAVEHLAAILKVKFIDSSVTKALTAESTIDGKTVWLLKPLTFMNNSGLAVSQFIKDRKIPLDHFLVVCDDLNLPFGQLRIRPKGSDGGNNGLSSIIYHLESNEFARLRMGIDKPAGNKPKETVDYVLTEFPKDQKKRLGRFSEEAAQCCMVWLKEGLHKAMEQFNRRKENG